MDKPLSPHMSDDDDSGNGDEGYPTKPIDKEYDDDE